MDPVVITLRLATLADADLLRSWRNDPDMRRNSFHGSIVGKAEHMRWMKATLKNRRRRLYIAEWDWIFGRTDPVEGLRRPGPVGTGRLDFDGDLIELAVEIAPDSRGLGYGGQLVCALVREARAWKPGIPLVAHVKEFNTASLRAFMSAGFNSKSKRCVELEME